MKITKIYLMMTLFYLGACSASPTEVMTQYAAPQTPAQVPVVISFAGDVIATKNVANLGKQAIFSVKDDKGNPVSTEGINVTAKYNGEVIEGDACGSMTNEYGQIVISSPKMWPNTESVCSYYISDESGESFGNPDVYFTPDEDFVNDKLALEVVKVRNDAFGGDLSEAQGILHSCFRKLGDYEEYEVCEGKRDSGVKCKKALKRQVEGLFYAKYVKDEWFETSLSKEGYDCKIASNNNNVTVVWKEALPKVNERGFDYDYQIVFSSNGGESFDNTFVIEDINAAANPSIAIDKDNVAYILYDSLKEGKYIAWFDNSGIGAKQKVSDIADAFINKLTYDDYNNMIYAVWAEKFDGGYAINSVDVNIAGGFVVGETHTLYELSGSNQGLMTLNASTDAVGNLLITYSILEAVAENQVYASNIYMMTVDRLTHNISSNYQINDVDERLLPLVGSCFADYYNSSHCLYVSFGENPELGNSGLHYSYNFGESITIKEELNFEDWTLNLVVDGAGKPYAIWDTVNYVEGEIDSSDMWMLRPVKSYEIDVEESI